MSIRRLASAGVYIYIIVLIMFPSLIIEHGRLGISYYTDSSRGLDTRDRIDTHDAKAWSAESRTGVAITFNGGSVDEWYDIRHLMNRYDAKMTLFVTKFNLLSDDEVEKLKVLKREGHEIACQGLQYLDAVEFMKNHSLQTYLDEEIFPAVNLMSEQGLTPTSFAYPFGSRNSTIDAELIEYFVILRGTTYTSNETRVVDLDQAYYDWQYTGVLQAVGVDNTYENTVEEIVEGLERAKSNNEVLLLYGHIPSTTSDEYVTPIDKLETILSSAEAMGLSFFKISNLVPPPIESTKTTSTGNGMTTPTASIVGLDEIGLTVIVSSAGIVILWVLATIIFPGKRGDVSYLPSHVARD